jgi:hypothetical protein
MKRTFSEWHNSFGIPDDKDLPTCLSNKNSDLNNFLPQSKIKLTNKTDERIKTFCRLRPTENHQVFTVSETDKRTLKCTIPEELLSKLNQAKMDFNFTEIFTSQSTQLEVFTNCCVPLINDMIKLKKSGLIFAYGLTNAGKTYTIVGKITFSYFFR